MIDKVQTPYKVPINSGPKYKTHESRILSQSSGKRTAEKQEPLGPRSGEQRYIARVSPKLEVSEAMVSIQ